MTTVSFRVPTQTKSKLDAITKRRGCTISSFLTTLVNKQIEREEQELQEKDRMEKELDEIYQDMKKGNYYTFEQFIALKNEK